MLNHTSTTAIARTLLLAGILVAVTVLAARTFVPAFAQDPEAGPQPYAENGTDPVAVFSATDPEGQTITWSISEALGDGEDHDDFKISPSGVLEFKNVPNFEDPTSRFGTTREEMNTYTVTVVATDTEDAADKETLTISVTNVDEDGEITLGTLQPLEKIDLVATLRDPDGRVIADGRRRTLLHLKPILQQLHGNGRGLLLTAGRGMMLSLLHSDHNYWRRGNALVHTR